MDEKDTCSPTPRRAPGLISCWEEGLGHILHIRPAAEECSWLGAAAIKLNTFSKFFGSCHLPSGFSWSKQLGRGNQRNRENSRQSWPASWVFSAWQLALAVGVSLGDVRLIGATTHTRVTEKMPAQMRNQALMLLLPPFTRLI